MNTQSKYEAIKRINKQLLEFASCMEVNRG